MNEEQKRLRADARVFSLLRANRAPEAAEFALHKLQVAGLRPIHTCYYSGSDSLRLAAALLIPVWTGKALSGGILHEAEAREAHA